MHRVASTIFAPVCRSTVMARRGHAAAHRGSEHCWQVKGRNLPASCIQRGVIRDSTGLKASSCSKEQASAQVLHPMHFSGSARIKYCIYSLQKVFLRAFLLGGCRVCQHEIVNKTVMKKCFSHFSKLQFIFSINFSASATVRSTSGRIILSSLHDLVPFIPNSLAVR